MAEINWRKLLIAYIRHVEAEESVAPLPATVAGLTPDENAALHQAALEFAESTPGFKAEWIAKLRAAATPLHG